MRLTFLGHAAMRLEIGAHEILVDPFPSGDRVASIVSETDARRDVLASGEALDL